jgi:hypothetical protein
MIRRAFGEENMNRTRKIQTHGEIGEEQNQEHAHIKEIVYEEFILGDRTVISAFYCDVLRRLSENVLWLRPRILATKRLAVASQQRAISHFLF